MLFSNLTGRVIFAPCVLCVMQLLDICTHMRDSQYVADDVSDEQLNQVASRGLDRLHYEVDPCVKFNGKVWVYLHRNRGVEDFEEDATFHTDYLTRKS